MCSDVVGSALIVLDVMFTRPLLYVKGRTIVVGYLYSHAHVNHTICGAKSRYFHIFFFINIYN